MRSYSNKFNRFKGNSVLSNTTGVVRRSTFIKLEFVSLKVEDSDYINAILQMMVPSKKKGFIWSFLVSDWFWLKKIRVKVTRLHSSKHQLYRTSLNSCFWTYRILQNFARGPDKEKTSWLSLKKLKWYSWMRTCIFW